MNDEQKRAFDFVQSLLASYGDYNHKKIIPHAFGERPVLKLMYAAMIRAADCWRGIAVGEFEQRQLRAIRDALDRAHTERVRPDW